MNPSPTYNELVALLEQEREQGRQREAALNLALEESREREATIVAARDLALEEARQREAAIVAARDLALEEARQREAALNQEIEEIRIREEALKKEAAKSLSDDIRYTIFCMEREAFKKCIKPCRQYA
jgi:hypothetical protein